MNYADADVPYTRVHEFRHLHHERNYATERSIICREYPKACAPDDEPYYPVRAPDDLAKLARYSAENAEKVIFGGRLGAYAYLNMDQVIEQALDVYEQQLKYRVLNK